MADDEVLAAANARYEAFRMLLPKVFEDVQAVFMANGTKVGWDIRAQLVAAATAAAARLAADDSGPRS